MDQFDHPFVPFSIGIMKLSGTLFTEIINILLICSQTTVMNCVLNFIALAVIAEIDDMYAASLKDLDLK